MRLAARALALGAAAVLATAAPAAADPPRPTNDRSEILTVEPALPEGVELRVVGGDAFLELRVAEGGPEVIVPDYGQPTDGRGVPYLRFAADGTVERNDRATATAANESRYGTSDASADPEGAAAWSEVADDGTYAWHDHRIHWMSPRPPRAVADDGTIDLGGPDGTWEVALVVDGSPTTVVGGGGGGGGSSPQPAPSPWPWALLSLAVAGGGIVLARHRPRALALLGFVAGLAATDAALATFRAAPADAGATPVPILVALVAALSALGALVGPPRARTTATALAAAALLGWSVLRLDVWTHAVLPTTVEPALDRGATALALGVGVALAASLVVVRSSRPA